jgi:hypothetical protein
MHFLLLFHSDFPTLFLSGGVLRTQHFRRMLETERLTPRYLVGV